MIKVQVDKIWLGKVSVRDYIYKKALRKKESLGIVHGKEYMLIPYANLKKQNNTQMKVLNLNLMIRNIDLLILIGNLLNLKMLIKGDWYEK